MTVFQNWHRGGVWQFDFRVAGKRHQGQCIGEDGKPATGRREAKEHETLARARARALAGKPARSISRPGTFTFGQALLLHLEKAGRRSPLHAANLKMYARELVEEFGDLTPVVDITQERIDAYRRKASQAKVAVWRGGPRSRKRIPEKLGKGDRARSPASVNHRLNCLRGALNQAHLVKDPVTGTPMLPFPPAVAPVAAPKRRPRPMPDAELFARLDVAPPWVREAAELARYFGLRRSEALGAEISHIDHDAKALRFDGATTKSGRDEFAQPLPGGWALLMRLERQARARRQKRLVTWPGPKHMATFMAGKTVPLAAWRPLKSIRRAWRTTAEKAKVARPHRYHDTRARYITEIAKVASSATTQEAARHQDAATTARYTAIGQAEVAKALRGVPRPKKRA